MLSPSPSNPGLRFRIRTLNFLSMLLLLAIATEQFYLTSAYRPYPDPGPDIYGRFCKTRPRGNQCCPGRDDFCTAPILDTVCYCDAFCNRTVADCCPDFWNFCLGVPPPSNAMTPPPPITKRCYRDGHSYQPGQVFKENCNNCTCVGSGTHYDWSCTGETCLIRGEIIGHVNDDFNRGWTATNYSFLWGTTLNDGKRYRLGTLHPEKAVEHMSSLRLRLDERLPQQYDARDRHDIHPVMDQGNCGASWAFSTTSVAADRLLIHSAGRYDDMLSPQNLLSCDLDYKQLGCEGGHLDRAWWYMRKFGVVSGECYPYISGRTNNKGTCQITRSSRTRSGLVSCPKSALRSRVFKTTPPYRIAPREKEIMKEIMVNGPVQAIMNVKEDFYMYERGVYSYSRPHTGHDKGAYHSVKIIGWGVDASSGSRYWLCANSWGTQWGENGYFKILRGENECEIESFVIGVWGKVDGRQVVIRRQEPDAGAFNRRRAPLTARQEQRRGRRNGERKRKNRKRKHNNDAS